MRVCVCVGEGGPLHILTHQGRPTGSPDIKATTEQVVTCMEPASPCTPPPSGLHFEKVPKPHTQVKQRSSQCIPGPLASSVLACCSFTVTTQLVSLRPQNWKGLCRRNEEAGLRRGWEAERVGPTRRGQAHGLSSAEHLSTPPGKCLLQPMVPGKAVQKRTSAPDRARSVGDMVGRRAMEGWPRPAGGKGTYSWPCTWDSASPWISQHLWVRSPAAPLCIMKTSTDFHGRRSNKFEAHVPTS